MPTLYVYYKRSVGRSEHHLPKILGEQPSPIQHHLFTLLSEELASHSQTPVLCVLTLQVLPNKTPFTKLAEETKHPHCLPTVRENIHCRSL